MTRVQRQKRKFVTVIAGLETVPDLKIKDATKLFGKKFAASASVNEAQGGGKEVVIQGDVLGDLPALLMSEYKVRHTYRIRVQAYNHTSIHSLLAPISSYAHAQYRNRL
jgi:density-regulated protein DRP1